MVYSANLGFLFKDKPLIEAVTAAKKAGFAAIECHFPYDTPAEAFWAALDNAGLPLLGLNTLPGDLSAGDFGLAALINRVAEARAKIDRAIEYARLAGARAVHVMAGRTDGGAAAEDCYLKNLEYAAEQAGGHGLDILIEPLNHRDVEGYHLYTVEHANAIVAALDTANLKIMFDCYHIQIQQGDVLTRFKRHISNVGHIQFAAVPDRGEPDAGELDYSELFPALRRAGYTGYFGAEYKPRGRDTESGLNWMRAPWAAIE